MHAEDEEKINMVFFKMYCKSYTFRLYDVVYNDAYSSNDENEYTIMNIFPLVLRTIFFAYSKHL